MGKHFEEALRTSLDDIPRGRAATCGTIARALGDMRAARTVATWLLEHPDTPGGHRVVRADGRPILRDLLQELRREGAVMVSGRVETRRLIDRLPEVPFLSRLREEQRKLASRVREEDEPTEPQTFGGADVSYAGNRAFAAAVVLDATQLETLEIAVTELEVDFPYIPTYLAFRESPAIEAVMYRLSRQPDLLFVDGHGRLHPALCGVACFVGVRLDIPTIGIAKHPLVGTPRPAKRSKEGGVPIELDGAIRGYAWTPPGHARPFYVSVGHRISLRTALTLARVATWDAYPEPLRSADRISKEKKEQKNAERSASGQTASWRPPAQGRQGI